MKNDLISVIITVYNVERYLRQCLDSVLAQTYRKIEVILVDDGSVDSSPDICDEYVEKDARVHVIHKNNEGAPKARKVGCEYSKGEYLSIIDADDWLEQDMIEKLYRAITLQDVQVAMCGRFEESEGRSRPVKQGIAAGTYSGSRLSKEVFPRMMVNQEFFEWGIFPSYWDKLFRRDTLYPYLFQVDDRIPMGNDAAGVYPLLSHVESITILDECLYHYRQTDESMVRRFDRYPNKRKGFRILYQSVLKEFAETKPEYLFQDQWLEYVLFLMVPRADELYEGMCKLDYLFPFPKVKRNSKIVLYGMGLYGQRLFAFLKATGFCQVEAVADQNYEALRGKGLPVISPDEIGNYHFDAIVVSLSFANAVVDIKGYLSKRFATDMIHTVNRKIIKEERALKALGLICGGKQIGK